VCYVAAHLFEIAPEKFREALIEIRKTFICLKVFSSSELSVTVGLVPLYETYFCSGNGLFKGVCS
jgi:hypothetical protein